MKHLKITVDGKVFDVTVEEQDEKKTKVKPEISQSNKDEKNVDANIVGEKIVAPMAGNITEIKVNVGQLVKKGDIIAIMEIMKMENEIISPNDGKIISLQVEKGQNVSADQVIAVLE